MRNIGLVLSGGMAKGAYQIGALRAIGEVFQPSDFKFVSAASVGALNLYAFLTYGLDDAIKIWQTAENSTQRKWVMTLLKSTFVQDSIAKIVSNVEIENSFYVPLVNIKKRKLTYANLSKVPVSHMESYLRASVAMPVFNTGVKIGNDYFYDGAMIDNIPIKPILKYAIDYVICLHFDNYNYTFESEYLDNKVIKLNFSDGKFMFNSLSVKSDSVEQMMADGYKKTKHVLDYIFAKGTEDLDTIYAKIETLNSLNASRRMRITGDVIVGNMNKIARKFMNKIEVR